MATRRNLLLALLSPTVCDLVVAETDVNIVTGDANVPAKCVCVCVCLLFGVFLLIAVFVVLLPPRGGVALPRLVRDAQFRASRSRVPICGAVRQVTALALGR